MQDHAVICTDSRQLLQTRASWAEAHDFCEDGLREKCWFPSDYGLSRAHTHTSRGIGPCSLWPQPLSCDYILSNTSTSNSHDRYPQCWQFKMRFGVKNQGNKQVAGVVPGVPVIDGWSLSPLRSRYSPVPRSGPRLISPPGTGERHSPPPVITTTGPIPPPNLFMQAMPVSVIT